MKSPKLVLFSIWMVVINELMLLTRTYSFSYQEKCWRSRLSSLSEMCWAKYSRSRPAAARRRPASQTVGFPQTFYSLGILWCHQSLSDVALFTVLEGPVVSRRPVLYTWNYYKRVLKTNQQAPELRVQRTQLCSWLNFLHSHCSLTLSNKVWEKVKSIQMRKDEQAF